jgi:integrase
MTWNKDQRRWFKKYRAKMHSVSTKQLGTGPTKQASRTAANEWWAKKQEEIDERLGAAKKHPAHITTHYETAKTNHRLYAKWHRRNGNLEEATKSEAVIEWLDEALKTDSPPFPLKKWQEDPLWDQWHDEMAFGIWRERINQVMREEAHERATPKENTIRAHVDDYLTLRRTRVASGKNTLGTFDTYRGRLLTFRRWIDPTAPLEDINEALWERFCVYLSQQVETGKLSQTTISATMAAAREFIRSRWERRLIDLPRNLNSRTLAVSPPLKTIALFSTEEIDAFFAAALPRERLYLLLMLNTGCYPVDVARLRQDEVDWEEGRIIRKRTKTRGRSDKVPTVNYRLWRESFTLLTKYRSADPEFVLLNRNGTPLWKEVEKNGKFTRVSNIKCNFFRLQKKTGIKKSLKQIRKTAASMLENHPEYGRYAEYFLGEVPRSVTSRHYVQPSKEQFDAALTWLGEQFGFD